MRSKSGADGGNETTVLDYTRFLLLPSARYATYNTAHFFKTCSNASPSLHFHYTEGRTALLFFPSTTQRPRPPPLPPFYPLLPPFYPLLPVRVQVESTDERPDVSDRRRRRRRCGIVQLRHQLRVPTPHV